MAENGFDTSELDDLAILMDGLVQNYPKKAEQLMRKLGGIARKNLRAQTRQSVNRKTGNLLKGIDRGRPYLYQGDTYEIRVYNKAPHAHLIEHGHRVVSHGRDTGKRAPGYHPASAAIRLTDSAVKNGSEVEDFIDELLKEGFAL